MSEPGFIGFRRLIGKYEALAEMWGLLKYTFTETIIKLLRGKNPDDFQIAFELLKNNYCHLEVKRMFSFFEDDYGRIEDFERYQFYFSARELIHNYYNS